MALRPVIRGRGDYTLGGQVGSKVGGWIGDKLHGWFSRIFGSGDYTVDAQSAGDVRVNTLKAGNSVASFSNNGNGGDTVRIINSEYIGNIDMTSAFNCRTFAIDITDPRTFPWASRFSRNFQQWRVTGLVFALNSLSSDNAIAPTQGMGSISGAIRYDISSDAPTDKSELMNSMFASSARPSRNQAFPVECAPKMTIINPLKVQPPGPPRNDLQFYQMCLLDIVTEGAANDYPDAAELHVIYELELLKPCLRTSVAGASFFVDLTAQIYSSPLDYLPDTPGVTQPRFDTIGLTRNDDRNTFLPFIPVVRIRLDGHLVDKGQHHC